MLIRTVMTFHCTTARSGTSSVGSRLYVRDTMTVGLLAGQIRVGVCKLARNADDNDMLLHAKYRN